MLTFVSLWDIMQKYDIVKLARAIEQLLFLECYAKRRSDKGEQDLLINEQFILSHIDPILRYCSEQCIAADLTDSYERINHDFRGQIAVHSVTMRDLQSHVREIRHYIWRELRKRTFIFVTQDKVLKVIESSKEWTPIVSGFPHIFNDVEDSQDCFAVGKDTAAVFHLMRVAEWGLRALCVHLGFRNIKSKIKATGKVEFTPIAYTTWDGMLGQLRIKVNMKLARLQRGSTKQKLQEFYLPMIEEIEAFKDAWRNHVMHNRKSYTPDDVLAIASHVRRFMDALVSHGICKV